MFLNSFIHKYKPFLRKMYNQRQPWHWNYLDFGRTDSVFQRRLMAELNKRKNGTLLDFGCGLAQPNKSTVIEHNWNYVGMDVFASPGIEKWEIGSEIKMAGEQAEIVLCNGVIFLVNDMDQIIDEFYRVLKSGGVLMLTTPILSPLSTSLESDQRDSDEYIRLMPSGIINYLQSRGFVNVSLDFTPGGLGTILGLFLYYLWTKLFKSSYEKIRPLSLPFLPIFFLLSILLNLFGGTIDRFFGDKRFSSLFCAYAYKG